MFLLKLALRPWLQSPLGQMASALALGVLLSLAMLVGSLQSHLLQAIERLQGEQLVTLYLEEQLSESEEGKVVAQVQALLAAQPHAPQSRPLAWVKRAEFLRLLRLQDAKLAGELEQLEGSLLASLVPRYLTLAGFFSQAILDQIRQIPGIESLDHQKNLHQELAKSLGALKKILQMMLLGLLFALAIGLFHWCQMNGALHQEALAILQLWGAGKRTLLAPDFLSGALMGGLGGCLAWAGFLALGMGVLQHLKKISPLLEVLPLQAPQPWVIPLGLLLGGVAGLMSRLVMSRLVQGNAQESFRFV